MRASEKSCMYWKRFYTLIQKAYIIRINSEIWQAVPYKVFVRLEFSLWNWWFPFPDFRAGPKIKVVCIGVWKVPFLFFITFVKYPMRILKRFKGRFLLVTFVWTCRYKWRSREPTRAEGNSLLALALAVMSCMPRGKPHVELQRKVSKWQPICVEFAGLSLLPRIFFIEVD